MSTNGPNVTAQKVYFPSEGQTQVHQNKVCACPPGFPASYYWYGGKRQSSGDPPKWLQKLLSDGTSSDQSIGTGDQNTEPSDEEMELTNQDESSELIATKATDDANVQVR